MLWLVYPVSLLKENYKRQDDWNESQDGDTGKGIVDCLCHRVVGIVG